MDGTLDLNGQTLALGVSLDGTGTITNSNSTAAGTVIFGWSPYYGSTGDSDTFGGNIVDGAGTVALAVNGSGSLTLTGTNTYSGDTTISDGTLVWATPWRPRTAR